MLKLLSAGILAGALTLSIAGQALAFDCLNPNKQAGAGSAFTIEVFNEEAPPTPNKNNPGTFDRPHGGFITIQAGDITADTFSHKVLPPVMPGGPHHNCDGKGLDSAEVCFEG